MYVELKLWIMTHISYMKMLVWCDLINKNTLLI
jgi:hypothetical protein